MFGENIAKENIGTEEMGVRKKQHRAMILMGYITRKKKQFL
jgi:hypothetical protein